jgi:hypothetical protein
MYILGPKILLVVRVASYAAAAIIDHFILSHFQILLLVI